MKNSFYVLLLVTLVSCTNKEVPADFVGQGEWKSLDNLEYHDYYVKFQDHIYGVDLGTSIQTEYMWYDTLKVDTSTFEYNTASDYTKDKNKVYYPITVECIESDVYLGACVLREYVVEGADPETFRYIGDEYAIDKDNMYFKGVRIPWNNDIFDDGKRREKALVQYYEIEGIPVPQHEYVDTIPIIDGEYD